MGTDFKSVIPSTTVDISPPGSPHLPPVVRINHGTPSCKVGLFLYRAFIPPDLTHDSVIRGSRTVHLIWCLPGLFGLVTNSCLKW